MERSANASVRNLNALSEDLYQAETQAKHASTRYERKVAAKRRDELKREAKLARKGF